MKRIIGMLIFVLVLGGILTTTLLLVDYYTTPIIAANEGTTFQASVLEALGVAYDESQTEEAFSRSVDVVEESDERFYIGSDGSVAFEYSGNGLWGPITGIIALNPDGETIKAITIIHQEETPGLGGRIAEQEYLNEFQNRPYEPALRVTAPGKVSAPTDIDGITGATMTSNAFVDILNRRLMEAISVYKEVVG